MILRVPYLGCIGSNAREVRRLMVPDGFQPPLGVEQVAFTVLCNPFSYFLDPVILFRYILAATCPQRVRVSSDSDTWYQKVTSFGYRRGFIEL